MKILSFLLFFFICCWSTIIVNEFKEKVKISTTNFTSLSEITNLLNAKDYSKSDSFQIMLPKSETLRLPKLQFEKIWDLNFFCEVEMPSLCNLEFSASSQMIFNGGNASFTGVQFNFLGEDNSEKSQILNFKDTSFKFKNCSFFGTVQGLNTSILDIKNGSVIFSSTEFSLNLEGLHSAALRFSNSSRVEFQASKLFAMNISCETNFLFVRESNLKVDGLFVENISVSKSNWYTDQEIASSEIAIMIASNSDMTLQNMTIRNLKQVKGYFLSIKNCQNCSKLEISNIQIDGFYSENGVLAYIRDINVAVEVKDLKITNSIFARIFYFEILRLPSSAILTKISITDTYFGLFAYMAEVSFSTFESIHLENNYNRKDIYQTNLTADAFLYLASFISCKVQNLTINQFQKKLPCLIFKNPSVTPTAVVEVTSCSFKNTRINIANLDSALGVFHGGVLSFNSIKGVCITDTLFKENYIIRSPSIMGSSAIYFDSKENSDMLLVRVSFISNKADVGPYLISFTGYHFSMNESFIINTTFYGNGALGQSMIKLKASFVDISLIRSFNNLMTDGQINIIETFNLNRISVKFLVACNCTSIKRAAAALLLDGSSKDREVNLEDSLFVNNTANTQCAAGIHIFHTSVFKRLNITYNRNSFYYNIASIGTLWWLRVAKVNSFIWIMNSQFHSSFSFFRLSDWDVGYTLGVEKYSFFTIKNTVINRTISRKYTILIKDLFAELDNVTLVNQEVLNPDASTFRIKGMGIKIQNCLIANQTSKSIYIDVNDNVTLLVMNTTFQNISTSECSLFAVTKSRILIYDSRFFSIKIDAAFRLILAGEIGLPCVFENNSFFDSNMALITARDSYLALRANKYKSLLANIFSLDSSGLEVTNDELVFIDNPQRSGLPLPCILKALTSNITMNGLNSANLTSNSLISFYFIKSSSLRIINSLFGNITSNTGRGLISAQTSSLSLEGCRFTAIDTYVVEALKSSLLLNENTFIGSQKENEMKFIIQLNGTLTANLSKNAFKAVSLEKAAINAFEMNDGSSTFYLTGNRFEEMLAGDFKGSCLHFVNVNANIHQNTFTKNKANEAGAIYFYCDINEPDNTRSECQWNLTENTFENNVAKGAAGALKWSFIPPLNQTGNKYVNNKASNSLQYESFPAKIAIVNSEACDLKIRSSLENQGFCVITNQTSGEALPDLKLVALDTYGQKMDNLDKFNIDIVTSETALPVNKGAGDDSKLGSVYDKLLNSNKILNSLYDKKESIYKEKLPSIFGRTILQANASSNEIGLSLNTTFLIGTPAFTVFVNVSSPYFFFNKKNISLSALFKYLNSSLENTSLNEIRSPTSYSYVIPVKMATCGNGVYFDPEKSLCEPCRSNSYNYKYNQSECKPCPVGLSCKGENNIEVLPGFWRISNQTELIYSCDKFTGNCLGGVNSSCSSDYEGVLCSACKENEEQLPKQKGYSLKCEECPPVAGILIITFFFCAILFLLLWIFAYIFFSNTGSPVKQAVLKCLVNYLHTFILISTYNQNGGVLFDTYMTRAHHLSQVIKFWFSLECFSKIITSLRNFSIKYVSELFFFHIFLVLLIFLKYRRNKSMGLTNLKMKTLEEMLLIWYIFYPGVLDHLFNNSMCIHLNDDYHLLTEPNNKCSSNEIAIMIILNVVLLFFWIIYGPLKILSELRLIKSFFVNSRETQNILQIDYKEKFLDIEVRQYFFKCSLFAINASSLSGDIKILVLWPIFFYYLIIESKSWKFFNLKMQVKGQIITIFNYLLVAYGCLWLTLSGSSAIGDTFFAISILLQFGLFLILFEAYFDTTIIQLLRKSYRKCFKPSQKKVEGGDNSSNMEINSKVKYVVSSPSVDQLGIHERNRFNTPEKSSDFIPEENSNPIKNNDNVLDPGFYPCPSSDRFKNETSTIYTQRLHVIEDNEAVNSSSENPSSPKKLDSIKDKSNVYFFNN